MTEIANGAAPAGNGAGPGAPAAMPEPPTPTPVAAGRTLLEQPLGLAL
jgi:hypothetical protein